MKRTGILPAGKTYWFNAMRGKIEEKFHIDMSVTREEVLLAVNYYSFCACNRLHELERFFFFFTVQCSRTFELTQSQAFFKFMVRHFAVEFDAPNEVGSLFSPTLPSTLD